MRMSLISKRGLEVKEDVNREEIDMKRVYIRLKDGDSVRVRILGVEDYVQYKAHSNGFNYGLYTQPCLRPTGARCPICEAYEYDKEEYRDLRPSNRYLIAMADLDEGMVRVWDCSKAQLKGLISQIEEYKDEINDPDSEMMFTFKRTGTKTNTTYTLSPIINKKAKADLTDAYHKFDDTTVEDSFFEGCLQPRTESIIMTALKQAGLPVETIFPEYVFETTDSNNEVTPVDGEDLPF